MDACNKLLSLRLHLISFHWVFFFFKAEYHAVIVHITLKALCGGNLQRKKDKCTCAAGVMMPASCPVSVSGLGWDEEVVVTLHPASGPGRCYPCWAEPTCMWRWVFLCPWSRSWVWWAASLGCRLFSPATLDLQHHRGRGSWTWPRSAKVCSTWTDAMHLATIQNLLSNGAWLKMNRRGSLCLPIIIFFSFSTVFLAGQNILFCYWDTLSSVSLLSVC